jgi:hypothetical protein
MATLTLTLSPSNPAPGATVTATYAVTGAPADRVLTVNGDATLDGAPMTATGTFTLTHTTTFSAPTAAGMTFVATADPKVWTATAPAA